MATRTWVGSTHNITDGAAWSPTGAPQAGDTAIVATGTATASYQVLAGYTLEITARTDYPGAIIPSFDFTSLILGPSLDVQGQPAGFGGMTGTMGAAGSNVNEGTITVGPYTGLTIDIDDVVAPNGVVVSQGSFLNTGTIGSVYPGANVYLNGQSQYSQLINDGTLDSFGNLKSCVPITGTGAIDVYSPLNGGYNGQLDLFAGVSAGQTIDFNYQNAANAGVPYQPVMQLDDPQQFYGVIANFAQEAEIRLENISIISDSFNNGVLMLSDASGVVAQLKFAGTYSAGQFNVGSDGSGNTLITVTGQPGSGSGGSGANTGDVVVPTPPTSPIPQSGSEVIASGDWTAADQTIASAIQLGGTSATSAPSLDVTGVALASGSTITAASSSYGGVGFVGSNEADGFLGAASNGNLSIDIADINAQDGVSISSPNSADINRGVLLNDGTIEAMSGGTVTIKGDPPDTMLINNGTIGTSGGGTVVADASVIGSGSFDFNDGGTLLLDDPATFAATVTKFGGTSDSVVLVGTSATSDSFSNDVLTLTNGGSVVALLNFAGSYTTSDFVLTQSGSNTIITAPGVDPATQAAFAAARSSPDAAGAVPVSSSKASAMVAQQLNAASRFGATFADLVQHPMTALPTQR